MSNFISEPRNASEVTILPAYIKKAWLKSTLEDIENLIKNQTSLMDDPEKGNPVSETMHRFIQEKNLI